MKLKRFKLIDGGIGGIAITCTEYVQGKSGAIIPDDVTRTRKVSFPFKFLQNVSKLKYYFLNMTAHWIEPYDKYYDRGTNRILPLPETGSVPMGQSLLIELMNKTNITGAIFTGKGFLLTGDINSYGDKKVGISTRLVTEDDDAGFYNEAIGVIQSIFSDVGMFIKDGMILEGSPKEYLSQYGEDTNKEGFANLSEDELMTRVFDAMQKRGAIIMIKDGEDIPEVDNFVAISENAQEEAQIILNTGTGSIDGKHLEEVGIKDEKVDITQKMDPEKVNEKVKEIENFKNGKIDKEKHPANAGSGSKKTSGKKSKPADNDREFPPETISDEDIKATTGDIATEGAIPPEKGPKVIKKAAGSTLVSEKDFAEATGEKAPETGPVDLANAEFSENQNHEIDDWNQEQKDNTTNESEISNVDLEDSIIGQD